VDEREQNPYAESTLRYEVIGGGFFGGLAPLRVGRQTNLFTVNAYVAEVSGASRNYWPIFATGPLQWCFRFASLHTRHGITICLEQTIQETVLDKWLL
jgi:hypothetical protein